METQPDGSGTEQSQRALSPKSQLEQIARNAHSLADDADLFRSVYQYVTDPTPAQARLDRANAAAAGVEQDRVASGAPPPSSYPHVSNGPQQYPPAQSYVAQHPPAYGPSLQYLPQQAVMPRLHQASKPAQYWLPLQSAQVQSKYGMQNSNTQDNAQVYARALPTPSAQQANPGTMSQYRLAPPGTMPANTQLIQPAPLRAHNFTSQHTPSPSVTPNITTPISATPSTPNVSGSTPASTAPGDTPSSNLIHKQQMSRKHTRVSDVEDPAICHICFHMVVQKSSIKNHLVSVHGWSKEDARSIDIYSKSELLAAGYEIPPNWKPKKITSNIEAAANPDINKIRPKRKYAITNNLASPVTLPASGPPPKAGSVAPAPPNAGSKVAGTSTLKRYSLNLNPPGLVAPGKVLSSAKPLETANGLPALGGVFTGVNATAAQPSTSNYAALQGAAPSIGPKDTAKPLEVQPNSVVPAKRTHDTANAAEVQSAQAATLHRPELETVMKLESGQTQTLSQSLPAPSVAQTASNGSCVSGNRPNPGLKALPAPTSTSNVMPWLNGVESRKHTAQELQEIAKATLSLIPDDLEHVFGGNAGHMPGFLSQDLAARNAVISAVDYHEGTIAAASVQLELDRLKYQENSKDAEGTPSKRLKMSYGEIFVPEDYKSDERLANVDRDGSEAAYDVVPEDRIERIISTTPEPKEPDIPDVQVWDDYEDDAEESSTEGLE